MHALIIEDEGLIAVLIEDVLRDMGYRSFDHAPSVCDAVSAARHRFPDLITTDQQIIGGTGTEAVLEICSDRVVPVLFVTASGKAVRERIPHALILDKPFTDLTLCKFVREAVRKPFERGPIIKQ